MPKKFFTRLWVAQKFSRKIDYLLIGGGGLIQDTHAPYTIHGYLQYAFSFVSNTTKVGLVGVGIGPIKRSYARWYFRQTASRCSFIQVRDQHSAGFLKDIDTPLLIDTDIVAGSQTLEKYGFRRYPVEQPAVGCSIRPWTSLDFDRVANFIFMICQQKQMSCRLFVFEYERWNTEEDDYALRLQKFLTEKGIETTVFCYGKVPWETYTQAFGSVSCAIAVRFHANILWQKLGIPVLPISYAPKVKSLYEEKGGSVVPIESIDYEKIDDNMFQKINLSEEYQLPDLSSFSLNKPTLKQRLIVYYTTVLFTIRKLWRPLQKIVRRPV